MERGRTREEPHVSTDELEADRRSDAATHDHGGGRRRGRRCPGRHRSGPAGQRRFTNILPSSWAFTDVRSPRDIQLDPAGDLPVGAWRDEHNRRHISRAYFTFDLTEPAGRTIYAAYLFLPETIATNCADRQLEAWVTDPVTGSTSWVSPPHRRVLLEPGPDGHEPTPCPGFPIWDATDAVQQIANSGETLTIELQVPRQYMAHLEQGRWFSTGQAFLFVEYEMLPLPRPLVTSADYPPEPAGPVLGAGIPGEFTFDARGSADTVGFHYSWDGLFGGDPFNSPTFVLADKPGGSATLMLAPPTWGRSPSSSAEQPPVTVPAGPDGTATVQITLSEPALYLLRVRTGRHEKYDPLHWMSRHLNHFLPTTKRQSYPSPAVYKTVSLSRNSFNNIADS